MGLSLVFEDPPAPGMVDCTDNRLSARVDVNMLNNDALLSATTKLGQRIDLRSKRSRQASDRKRICSTTSR
jgi:hypothetical protein